MKVASLQIRNKFLMSMQDLWAKRLGVAASQRSKFDELFQALDSATQETAPPRKDGSRCPTCGKKVELDTHFKELCNGFCTPNGCRGRNKGASNRHEKILEIWRSLEPSQAEVAEPRKDQGSKIVGLPTASAPASAAEEEEEARAPRCRRVHDAGERCSGDALPDVSYCSRRCEAAEASRVARVARLARICADDDDAGPKKSRQASAPKAQPKTKKSLTSLLAGLEKPKAPHLPTPPPPPSDEEAASAALAELERFVCSVISDKYWPVFVSEEIDDLDTLRLLTLKDLQDLKLPLGPRLKLLKAVEASVAT